MNQKTKKHIKKYYNKRVGTQILGSLMSKPQLLKNKKYKISHLDFADPLHKSLFIAINNLSVQGVQQIGLNDIETYLHNSKPVDYVQIFEKKNGEEWINKIIEDTSIENFDYYYETLIKMSILRSKLEMGIDVKEILNIDEMDSRCYEEQAQKLDNMSIKDLLEYFDKKNLESKKRFVIDEEENDRKSGDDAEELRNKLKEAPSYGFSTESEYLNAITRGMRRKSFWLETRDTGTGKTRIAIKRLLGITAPMLWDFNESKFVVNKNSIGKSALYIGTEMDTYTELEPMMWAFVSGVSEDKIHNNDLTDEESKRVDKAIEILKETKLYLIDEENYDTTYLWYKIEEYVTEFNICAVAIDYLELNGALTSEYIQETKGMVAREDQILLNLSRNVKNMAKKFNIFIMGFTQTTDEARRDGVRDQRAVKGARSLPNKADVGVVAFEPTKKELEAIKPLLKKKGLIKHKEPNLCTSFYKNRGGKIKSVKVWSYQDLGNMEYYDLFCTDEAYRPINVNKVKIEVEE